MRKILVLLACFAAILGAFWIYHARLDGQTRSLGGIPMPDVSETPADRNSRQFAALLATQIRTNEVRLRELKSLEIETQNLMKFNRDFYLSMGIKTEPEINLVLITNSVKLRSRISDCEVAISVAKQQLSGK